MTEKRVIEILKNHEQEERVIRATLEEERAAYERDMNEILSAAFPSTAVSDAGVHVTSTPDPDAKMVNIVDKRTEREAEYRKRTERLEYSLSEIGAVYDAIFRTDSVSKCTLLALYYPYRTFQDAADFLKIDVKTIARRKQTAISALFKCLRKNIS